MLHIMQMRSRSLGRSPRVVRIDCKWKIALSALAEPLLLEPAGCLGKKLRWAFKERQFTSARSGPNELPEKYWDHRFDLDSAGSRQAGSWCASNCIYQIGDDTHF